MSPIIRDGDKIIVEKISRYLKAPVRGELMVFREPHERKEVFVKRVIGLPGETVKVERDSVTILHADGREELFQGDAIGGKDNGEPHTRVLGPEDYFVMGDNRSVSTDSRHWGTIQPADIIGRLFAVLGNEQKGHPFSFGTLEEEEKRGTLSLLSRLSLGSLEGGERVPLFGYLKSKVVSFAYHLLSLGTWEKREASGAYRVVKSLRFNDDDTAYFDRTPASAGDRQKFTLSVWVKRGNLDSATNQHSILGSGDGGGTPARYDSMGFYQDDLQIFTENGNTTNLVSSGVFRDPTAWGHLVVAFDTTQATASNRVKAYWNGQQITSWSTETYPSQNHSTSFNMTYLHRIGTNTIATTRNFDGYMADVNFVDGQQLTPSSFAETDTTTGAWKPKSYSGSYGTNGFKLDFSDCSGTTSSTLGNDGSSNNNDWTPNNFSVTAGTGNDCLTDSPTNYGTGTSGGDVRGNFATLNPLATTGGFTASNGNLRADIVLQAVPRNVAAATIPMSSGKWYMEAEIISLSDIASTNPSPAVGIRSSKNVDVGSGSSSGYDAVSFYAVSDGNVYRNQNGGGGSSWSSSNAWTTVGDKVMLAWNADTKQLWIGKNGTWLQSGDPAGGTSAATSYTFTESEHVFYVSSEQGSDATIVWDVNFGARPFSYTPPTGFKPLVTQHLSSPTIAKPSSYFDAKTYTGTGAAQSVTGLGFQPELVWLKDRSAAKSHMLFDTLRNVFPYLSSNSTGVETGGASTTLTAFTSDGFVLGTNSLFNTNTNSYISWNWKEGATPGFDIVTYTGTGSARTISHSLGAVPKMMIVKNRSSAGGWEVFHTSIGATKYLNLEATDAAAVSSALWNDTAPTASVFTVGTNANVNGSGSAHVAYLFSEVEGFSKFGSYTGNGSADGPFIYTGFKPRYILWKGSSGASREWWIADTARTTGNGSSLDYYLRANATNADSTGGASDVTEDFDFLANGFKVRDVGGDVNASGETFIYAAFAENVFKGPDHNSGYEIARSLRFNDDDSAYLTRTPSSASNQDTWTLSFWMKRANLSDQTILMARASGATTFTELSLTSNALDFSDLLDSGVPTYNSHLVSSALFRDPTAWYHVVLAYDSTQATAANRIRMYVNGVEQSAFSTASYPSQNTDAKLNSNVATDIGRRRDGANSGGNYFDGYLSDFYLIDGQQLTPSSFGETDSTTGMWKPKTYSGTYGTNGFNLNFSDNSGVTSSTLGNDTSGVNNNDWTPNNFSVTAGAGNDSLTDTPTNYGSGTSGGDVRGNFATLNSVGFSYTATPTLANGNLSWSTSGADRGALGTIGMTSGKWYWEVTIDSFGGAQDFYLGVQKVEGIGATPYSSRSRLYYRDGSSYNGSLAAYGNSYTTGDVIGVAVDMDNGKIFFAKNNTWQASGDPAAGTNAAFTDLASSTWLPLGLAGSLTHTSTWNFGQRAFTYTPPTGFKPLVATNIATSTIQDPSDYFDAKTYTGTGAALSVTGLEFQPNLVWIKDRTSTNAHGLFDSSRTAYPALISNGTGAEVVDSTTLTSFDSTGFSIAASSTVNTSSNNYISWNWDEGATPGFDIVTYVGTGAARTISHSLGAIPKMIITKRRDSTVAWGVGHEGISWNRYLLLNSTGASTADSAAWNNATGTASVFSVGDGTIVNTSGGDYTAYLWSEVEGFSKFGSYTGNGSADGPFVYTGFKPRWLLVKRTDAIQGWRLFDSARNTYNPVNADIDPNDSAAENTSSGTWDFLANGAKVRYSGNDTNASGGTYIYAAFAEMPFKYASAGFGGVTQNPLLFVLPF